MGGQSSAEAVKWLREAAVTGFQLYPPYLRDAYLNRIRQAPEFIQFLAEMKTQNDKYRQEFSYLQHYLANTRAQRGPVAWSDESPASYCDIRVCTKARIQ